MSLDFPLPSALGSEVRNPATFGLPNLTSYQTTPLPNVPVSTSGPIYGYSNNSHNDQSFNPNTSTNGNFHGNGQLQINLPPTLPPLRLPDRPSLSSPPSSVSIGSNISSILSYGQQTGYQGVGVDQPPPHTYPSLQTYNPSCAPSDQQYTPSTSGYTTHSLQQQQQQQQQHCSAPLSGSSIYLTPPGSGQIPALTNMTLPGVGSLLPPPPQLHLPPCQSTPTTVEPKVLLDGRSRYAYQYLTEPHLRGSSSSLSLFDSSSRFSHSPMSVNERVSTSISRSTSVESLDQHQHPKPVLGDFKPQYSTMLGGNARLEVERMRVVRGEEAIYAHEGLGLPEGGIYYTDDAETKQTSTVSLPPTNDLPCFLYIGCWRCA